MSSRRTSLLPSAASETLSLLPSRTSRGSSSRAGLLEEAFIGPRNRASSGYVSTPVYGSSSSRAGLLEEAFIGPRNRASSGYVSTPAYGSSFIGPRNRASSGYVSTTGPVTPMLDVARAEAGLPPSTIIESASPYTSNRGSARLSSSSRRSAAITREEEAAVLEEALQENAMRMSEARQSVGRRPTVTLIQGVGGEKRRKMSGVGVLLLTTAIVGGLAFLIYAILNLVAKHKLSAAFKQWGGKIENFIAGNAPKAVAAAEAVSETAKETASDVKEGAKKVASIFFDGSVPQLENEREASIMPLTQRHFNNLFRVQGKNVYPNMDGFVAGKRAIVVMIYKRGSAQQATCTAAYAPEYLSVAKDIVIKEKQHCMSKNVRFSSRICFTCIDHTSIPSSLVDNKIVTQYPSYMVYNPSSHSVQILDDSVSPAQVSDSIRDFYDTLNRELWTATPADGNVPVTVPNAPAVPATVPASAASPSPNMFQQFKNAMSWTASPSA